jgi:hypothetical protein
MISLLSSSGTGPIGFRQPYLVMQYRPERAVGEPSVELVIVVARQIHGNQCDRADALPGMNGRFGIGAHLAAPAEPDSAPGLQGVQYADS